MQSPSARLNCPGASPGLPQTEVEALALASQKVQHAIDGADIRKIIVVPDRLVNIVL
jgi:leucyl-tRNA synthetase